MRRLYRGGMLPERISTKKKKQLPFNDDMGSFANGGCPCVQAGMWENADKGKWQLGDWKRSIWRVVH